MWRPSLPRIGLNVAGLVLFGAVTAYVTARWGLVVLMRDWLWVWVLGLLLAVSLSDVRRFARGVLMDWLPFIGIIVAYDFLRGAVDPSIAQAHYAQQIDAERFL